MARRLSKGRRCTFESLENRRLLAGDVSAKIVNGNLVIKGDKNDNVIQITATQVVGVGTTINGATTPFAITGFTGALNINMGNGNDSVTTSGLTVSGKAKVKLGKGADTLNWDTTNIAGKTKIQAQPGDDVATITNSTLAQSVVRMGRGNDNLGVAGTTLTGQSILNGRRGTNILSLGTGNSLGATLIKRFVFNSTPTVDLNAVTPINENGAATLTGSFTDIDPSDTHSLSVDWRDPNVTATSTFAIPTTSTLAAGQTFNSSSDGAVLTITAVNATTGKVDFSVQHTYLDDGLAPGNATASDISNIQVAVFDVGAFPGIDTALVTVSNVAPQISKPADITINEGATATLTATITDPGTKDVFSVEVNWQDGANDTITGLGLTDIPSTTVGGTTFTWTAATRQLVVNHKYLDDKPSGADEFNVTFIPHDDDLGTGATQTTKVTVNNVKPTVTLVDPPAPPATNPLAFTLNGSYTDPGISDVQTLVVTWGDASTTTFTIPATSSLTVGQLVPSSSGVASTLKVNAIALGTGTVTFEAGHTYAAALSGIHITATIHDDDDAATNSDLTIDFNVA